MEPDVEHVLDDQEYLESRTDRQVEYLSDDSQSIVTENQSPDIPFRYSVNPYRGCAHGCAYCYARNSHEFLGLNAGLDFETKIIVKHDAPDLLRAFLSKPSWQPEPIAFSGITDCYQPAEREFRLTRRCLEVALAFQQPVSIITKNALVLRDRDLLQELAAHQLVQVFLSVTTLDAELARAMEPRTSVPAARLRAMSQLSGVGVPVGVMIAPVIPGLNDSEIPAILQASRQAGAVTAGYVLLRLPLTVEPVFREWLERTQPLKVERVLDRIRDARGGRLNRSDWGQRMVGGGEVAAQIQKMFRLFLKRHGLDQGLPPLDCSRFEPPKPLTGQLRLF